MMIRESLKPHRPALRFARGLISALAALTLLPAIAQSDEPGSDRICRVEKDKDGVEVPYQLFLPPDYDPARHYPLVLCLHGAGEMKSDEFKAHTSASAALLKPSVRAKYPAFILVPQTKTGWVRRPPGREAVKSGIRIDDAPESASMVLVTKALADVMQEYSVDPDRVYVTGQSMGGVATWDLIVRHPDLFAAAVPVCGIGDTTEAGKIRCPVWNFHGAKDPTVPVNFSREMVAALKAAGGTVQYTEYPDVGHSSWRNAWDEKDLIPWLFSQKRQPK